MTSSRPEPAQRLVALLETLPPDERQELTAWLLNRRHAGIVPTLGANVAWSAGPDMGLGRVTSTLPAGEDNQLVTIRLPTERHAQLRTWCADHGFTMAAVVRGLIERFLEQQQQDSPAPGE